MNVKFNEDHFLAEGSSLTRCSSHVNKDTQIRRFMSFFGASPLVCAMVWNILSHKQLHPAATRPLYLLCAFLFLRQYSVEAVNHAITGLDEKTFRHWCWKYVQLMAFELNLVSDNIFVPSCKSLRRFRCC